MYCPGTLAGFNLNLNLNLNLDLNFDLDLDIDLDFDPSFGSTLDPPDSVLQIKRGARVFLPA